jgi:hypothetical protein
MLIVPSIPASYIHIKRGMRDIMHFKDLPRHIKEVKIRDPNIDKVRNKCNGSDGRLFSASPS